MVKEVAGRLIASDISRSVVGLIFDLLKSLQCDSAEVRSFRKILPHQSAVVFQATHLPSVLGFAEVTLVPQQIIKKPDFANSRSVSQVIVFTLKSFKITILTIAISPLFFVKFVEIPHPAFTFVKNRSLQHLESGPIPSLRNGYARKLLMNVF